MPAGTFENDAIMEIIRERCRHLIVIFSDKFNNSPANRFFIKYAQWQGITRAERKVILCLPEECERPSSLDYFSVLYYNKQTKFYNFWTKLLRSVSNQSEILMSDTSNTTPQLLEINDIPNQIAEKATATAINAMSKTFAEHPKPKKVDQLRSLTISSRIDQLLSTLPKIVSHEPGSSTETDDIADKKKKWYRKRFRSRSKHRTAVKET